MILLNKIQMEKMRMHKRKISLPQMSLRADFQPSTFNDDDRSIEVTFSTGAAVKRTPYYSEAYIEELSMKKSHVNLERFKKGAPVLDSHDRYNGLDAVLGVVESARIVDGVGVARVRFSEREELQGKINDIKSGVIRNVSVGYVVHTFREMPEQDGVKVLRAVDWEPMELSFVAIPADMDSQSRNAQETFDCEIITNGVEEMKIEETEGTSARSEEQIDNAPVVETAPVVEAAPVIDTDKIRAEGAKAERKRVSEIRASVKAAKLSDDVADDFIGRGIEADVARKELFDMMAKTNEETRTSNISVGENLDVKSMRDGISGAMAYRMTSGAEEHTELSRKYQHLSTLEVIKKLHAQRGENLDGMSKMEIASRGSHSSSDFPILLANSLRKTLRRAYSEAAQTFAPIVRKTETADFKEVTRAQLGDAPALKKKLETGEYEYGTISESAEKYSLSTYGRVVALSREMIINDDLDAFGRLGVMFGRQAGHLESDLAWGVITSNPTMADGNALFSAAHGNIDAVGAALAVPSLGAAREAMRLQTSLDGTKLNVAPKYIYTPVALETVADQLTTQITPATSGDVNPFGPNGSSRLRNTSEPRLDDNSDISWYVFADTAQIDILEMLYLTGERSPVLDSMIDFDTDGMKMKARHTVACTAIDWRGAYKNVGA
jgi:phage head maturation protease